MNNTAIESWQADHVRVSLFSDTFWPHPEGAFKAISGSDPETINRKLSTGEHSAAGVWNDSQFTVQTNVTRLDIILQPTPSIGPSIGHLRFNELDRLVDAVIEWLPLQDLNVIRIAVGGNGLLPRKDRRDAYVFLQEALRVARIDVNRFQDFSFQVNLPVPSTVVNGLLLNKLSVWSSIEIKMGLLQVGASSPITPFALSSKSFASCVVDVNSVAEHTAPFARSEFGDLLKELRANAYQVLCEGID